LGSSSRRTNTISRAMSAGEAFGDMGDFSGHLDLVR